MTKNPEGRHLAANIMGLTVRELRGITCDDILRVCEDPEEEQCLRERVGDIDCLLYTSDAADE